MKVFKMNDYNWVESNLTMKETNGSFLLNMKNDMQNL